MIKKALKKILNRFGLDIIRTSGSETKKFLDKYSCIGRGTTLQDMRLDVRAPKEGFIYLMIGNDSLISGTFVTETSDAKIKIGNNTFIGGGLFVAVNEIEIGSDVMFAWGCTVMDNNAHSLSWGERKDDVRDWKRGVDENKMGKYKDWTNVARKKITIKDKAWIGFGSIILKGVTIGEGAVIGAGSVVVKDVPDWTIVAGNPAQPIRLITENER